MKKNNKSRNRRSCPPIHHALIGVRAGVLYSLKTK